MNAQDAGSSALDDLEALERAATPAEWLWDGGTLVDAGHDASLGIHRENAVPTPDDELIVALRNTAPALLRVAREARLLYDAQLRQILGGPPEDLSPYYGDLSAALDALEGGGS